MERSYFRQVKEALTGNAQTTLEGLGVKFTHGIKGEWSQCLCPFCGDTTGSASMTQEGFLRCHQCGRKQDLFDWHAEKHGLTAWDSCKSIGSDLGIQLEFKQRKGSRPPKVLTADILRESTAALWEDERAKGCLSFFQKRKIDDAQLLEQFGVGYLGGYIIFAQWTSSNHLRGCYRCYMPGGKPPWTWRGGMRGGTTGFWPNVHVPKEGVIWIMEGEWDVLTAWIVMHLQDQDIYCFTWTGGAGAPIPPHMIPEAWHGREIHILPDNDVFQGPVFEEHKAPDEKKKLEMGLRWRNLMDHIAPSFLVQNCKVFLRTIPIDPLKIWGGDFRDWVDGGGRNLSDLEPFLFKDMRPKIKATQEVSFLEAYRLAGSDVKFTAQLSMIDKAEISVPVCTALICDMGEMPYCVNCKAPSQFPSKLIHWKDHRDHLAKALMKRSEDGFDNHVMRQVIGKPAACVHAYLEHLEYTVCSKWTAVHDDEEQASERSLMIISEDTPSMSGDVEIMGRVHHANQTLMVMADRIRELDRAEIDLAPFINDFVQLCPTKSSKPEDIQSYLERRCADLSFNVTKVYGRELIHIAHELLAHSVLWFEVDGIRRRGWLDICIIGETATAKTETFKRLMDHHHLGTWQNSGENVSRAGLTMGGDRSGGGYKVKPGLFPRNNKKMLVLDEFHNAMNEDILAYLQGARDDGQVFAAKIFGSRMMPAAVRFCTIANWPHDRRKFRFFCEHVQSLYRTPEALRRMDFVITVADSPTDTELVEAPYEWDEARVRAGILRSWAMDESLVRIDPEAVKYARQKCEEWTGFYSPIIPLFTSEEKHLTLLRIAAAVSNLAFFHPQGEPYTCLVKVGHVEWAADFLQKTWDISGYDSYSQILERKKTLTRPIDAESKITLTLNLRNPADAESVLSDFIGGISMTHATSITGRDPYETVKWVSDMRRLEVFVVERDSKNAYHLQFRLSKAGDQLIRNMLYCAEEYPEAWVDRYQQLVAWQLSPHSVKLTPMTELREKLRHEWENSN